MVFDRHWLAITTISSRGGPAFERVGRRAHAPPTECALLTASRLMVLCARLRAPKLRIGRLDAKPRNEPTHPLEIGISRQHRDPPLAT